MHNDDKLREKCAVFGTFGASSEAARLAYYSLWSMQHRGQESSGIATSDGKKLYRHADFGLVANVYREEHLQVLPGHIAIGHNRYSTSGGRDAIYNQPLMGNHNGFSFAHNGNLPTTKKLEKFLAAHNIPTDELNDSGMMAAAIEVHIRSGLSLYEAVIKAYPLFEGVFSSVAMDKDGLVVFRDEYGIRPLSLGKLDSGYVVASETCAFETIGAEFERDVKPGEVALIDERGITSKQIRKPQQKLDIFEFVYFARPDSILLGKSVNTVRENFGRQLAKENKIDADVIIPVPDSSVPACIGFSKESGIPIEIGLVKNRYINRTFIRPTAELRKRDLKMKLNPVIDSLKGKKVALVDDSIVRGTTMQQVVSMLRHSGATEVHLMVTSPPVKFPDFYGINTPKQGDLIAAKMSVKEITKHVGADSLHFLSYDGMIAATGLDKEQFCTSCFDGVYPVPIGDRADAISYEGGRPLNRAKKHDSAIHRSEASI
ncbi:MAG TPA: amidophosphoribosyltransferase [Candidatus Saccharimonadales bacterium]|nr:amidophosphoribosyltransferase [Candidatus Saccharimonadales bacterium]